VRYLHQLNLVSREREPGSRRDQYVLHDDTWSQLVARREQVLERPEDAPFGGIAQVFFSVLSLLSVPAPSAGGGTTPVPAESACQSPQTASTARKETSQ
jgi:hypothetical protein